jgi:hypothetical protein
LGILSRVLNQRGALIAVVLGVATAAGLAHAPPAAAAPAARPDVVLELPAAAAAAVRALGPDVRFYTARARPLASLADITTPETQVATPDVGLARALLAFLGAGGVKLGGGAVGVARLTNDNHLAHLFRGARPPRLLVMRARPDGDKRLVEAGGAVPLVLRGPGLTAASAEAAPAPRPGPAVEGRTSFGPLRRVTLGKTARTRTFTADPMQVKPKLGEHQARAGQTLLVLHIERDFGAGLGTISFLFGSGIIVDPDFSPLVVRSSAGRHTVVASYADGPTLELIYALPAGARATELEDGAARIPLQPLLSAR